MIPRLRRPHTAGLTDRAKAELFARSETTSQEELWDILADETEAMSNEELRAELASLRVTRVRDFH